MATSKIGIQDFKNDMVLPISMGGTGATSADEVRANLGAAVTVTYTATLTAVNWSGEGPYTQTVAVSGITADDEPIADVVLSDVTDSSIYDTISSAWGCVGKIETDADSITATCFGDAPEIDFNIRLKVVK